MWNCCESSYLTNLCWIFIFGFLKQCHGRGQMRNSAWNTRILSDSKPLIDMYYYIWHSLVLIYFCFVHFLCDFSNTDLPDQVIDGLSKYFSVADCLGSLLKYLCIKVVACPVSAGPLQVCSLSWLSDITFHCDRFGYKLCLLLNQNHARDSFQGDSTPP